MTTEEVFEELRTIVEKIDHCFSVYKHTDPDGLVYIGFCRNDPKQRWDYGNGYISNKRFHEAIHRIGPKNFKHETIASGLTFQEARLLEEKMITEYESTNPEKGYNVKKGTNASNPYRYTVYTLHSPEGKMYAGYTGQPLKKRWNNGRGYPKNIALTDDIDFHGWDSFLKSINGEHLDEYSARNLEYYLIRRYDLTNPEKGYNQDYGGFSGERKKLPQKKEVHHAGKTAKRPVRCIETGELYPSAYEAGASKGIRPSSISAVCLGYHKTTHGYHWEYLYEKGTGDK